MPKYIFERLGRSLISLFIIITVVFLLVRLMPEEGYLGKRSDKMSEKVKEATLTKMGLRDPVVTQLGRFYGKLIKGDLGLSYIIAENKPVVQIIGERAPYSVAFGLAALAIQLLAGIPMGICMARYKSKIPDKLGTAFVVLINALPAIIYFLIIQVYVSGFFKIGMLFDKGDPITWILPCVCMSLAGIAGYAMWMRRYMVDELNKDYVQLALAKGVKRSDIMKKHVFRNAFVPMVQYLPASILLTLSGSIYVESLFSIPGMGGLLVQAVRRQDNNLVQALVLLFSAVGILGLLLGDILMAVVDPRIKLSKKEGAR